MCDISGRFFGAIVDRLDTVAAELSEIKTIARQLLKGQTHMALTMQDLDAKTDKLVEANGRLIAMAKEQAQMLRDALAGGDTAAQQAAMQAVADKLDAATAADEAEVSADTVAT